jgi:hypothetical protein
MLEFDPTTSMYTLSITGPMGPTLSVTLPKNVTTFQEFMKVDIYTGDSDPVYWAVARARHEWGVDWATRFSVAMLTFYHTGTAAEAADVEGPEFWTHLLNKFDVAPRGSARRHFRGFPGRYALADMIKFSPKPEDFFKNMPNHYKGVKNVCEKYLKQFGSYFQLKVCDFMDCCLTIPIQSYEGLGDNLPTEPSKSLNTMFPHLKTANAFNALCDQVKEWDLKAAPLFCRPAGPAEVETSLCGWYTTKFRGNWFGADIVKKKADLMGYGDRAEAMIGFIPEAPPRHAFNTYLLK